MSVAFDILRHDRAAQVGVALATVLIGVALVGPVFVRTDPNFIDVGNRFLGPSVDHPFGTDELGRDVLARIIHGTRTSLLIAVGAVLLATVVGNLIGPLAGYLGGTVDMVLTRITDLFFAIPTLLIAIGIVAVLGASTVTTIVAIGLAYCPLYIRLIRGTVVSLRDRQYVDASRVLGASSLRIVVKDVAPGILSVTLVQSTALIGYALIDEASLGFLGLGVQAPDASWGAMINGSRQFIYQEPRLLIVAGLAVMVAVFCVNLLGDFVGRLVDPRRMARSNQ